MEVDAPKVVDDDLMTGRALGVQGTPTSFIGQRQSDGSFKLVERLRGAQPVATFERALDRWLTSAAGQPGQ